MVNERARVPWTMRDDSCTSGFNAGNDEQGHQFANLSNLPLRPAADRCKVAHQRQYTSSEPFFSVARGGGGGSLR